MGLLKFGKGNNNAKLRKLGAKLGKSVFTFSIPAGYTCPGAKDCQARFDRAGGRIIDGEGQGFRCFAASMEAVFKGFREVNDANWQALRGCGSSLELSELILESLRAIPEGSIVRVHVAGDFYSETYFRAWMAAAAKRPGVNFYAYTKSVHILAKNMGLVPGNFSITVSEGGKFDSLITAEMKTSRVVFSLEEASVLGLEIDEDDSHAVVGASSFALRIHGQQRKGTKAAEALKAWKGAH